MAKDLIYYFSQKDADADVHYGHLLGEVQQGFNMAFTLDGTKDSVNFQVVSYEKNILEPYTIIYHASTETWWIVSNDKTKRYMNENGYMYVHELECLGAVELLNARDLTDCAFRSNKYTIESLTKRLVSLSNMEFNVVYIYNDLDKTQVVDYVKTFENYTLLSALREFYNGYNCAVKLSFRLSNVNNVMRVTTAVLKIIPKTGDNSLNTIDINDFTDVRESRSVDKNSFGTTVITNAQNVISTKAKTYPSVGSVRLSSNEYTITGENAVLKLPSKVYKLNWLRFHTSGYFTITNGADQIFESVFPTNGKSLNNFINKIKSYINDHYPSVAQTMIQNLEDNIDDVKNKIISACSVTLYDGIDINPVTGEIVKPKDMKYIPTFLVNNGDLERQIVIADKQLRDCLSKKEQGVYWERGSDEIKGFDLLSGNRGAEINIKNIANSNDLQGTVIYTDRTLSVSLRATTIVDNETIYLRFDLNKVSFSVNYVPMSDLKVLANNNQSTNDIQIYNQTGKLTDSVALSKLINSYAEEITSENITRYCEYYKFDDIPSVGQLVDEDGTKYVINNISLDFHENEEQNDNVQYKIETEISLSKAIAVKSLMVNANSIIRDYGIPQSNTIARKQIAKDIWEFSYIPTVYDAYLNLNRLLSFDNMFVKNKELSAVIKTTLDSGDEWYYQLQTTKFELKKQVIYELNFKDNNIIGYGSQNAFSGFDISRIFNNIITTVNTPISYVDDKGEVRSISIVYCSNEQITSLWDNYQIANGYGGNESYDLYNFSVFVPQEIYDSALASENNYMLQLAYDDYNKDALEVPVFEYCCQVRDSEDVVVGGNLLNNPNENELVLYGFAIVDNDTHINENNALTFVNTTLIPSSSGNSPLIYLEDGCVLSIDEDNEIDIETYDGVVYEDDTIEVGNAIVLSAYANKHLIVYKIVMDTTFDKSNMQEYLNNVIASARKELVLVAKNIPSTSIIANTLTIFAKRHGK